MALHSQTLVGHVASVASGVVRVRLRDDVRSVLVMIQGESYRVGQIGGLVRIPLGYLNLYAICTEVGADAAPPGDDARSQVGPLEEEDEVAAGYRWMTVVLFGESVGGKFERGVGQYPTVGDEVHVVTTQQLELIYSLEPGATGSVSIGEVAASAAIPGQVDVARLVSRHCSVVGSTGTGKSNLVTVLLEAISEGPFPKARIVVIDPHGEYGTALGEAARVFRVRPDEEASERPLRVPFWALPFGELQDLTLGGLQPAAETAIRDRVLELKTDAAQYLPTRPRLETITADSPVPFSVKQLWFELDRFERVTFEDRGSESKEPKESTPVDQGDPEALRPARFPPASPYNKAPYKNQFSRKIARQLDLMVSRLQDSRFSFLFSPGEDLEPDLQGRVKADLDAVVEEWVGHSKPISVFDVSDLPAEVLPTIVGTMLRIIYDMLFWSQELPVGGRQQPLLVIVDEAHRFVPDGSDTPAHRILSTISKEGRKYGVGLMLVSQRPSELDGAILSQFGSMVALRLTNAGDRNRVTTALPDDLGRLAELLPALRTGEGLFLGEIVPIPSRVRVRRARNKPDGDDPRLPEAWQEGNRPDSVHYARGLENWRAQSTSAGELAQPEREDDENA